MAASEESSSEDEKPVTFPKLKDFLEGTKKLGKMRIIGKDGILDGCFPSSLSLPLPFFAMFSHHMRWRVPFFLLTLGTSPGPCLPLCVFFTDRKSRLLLWWDDMLSSK